jgi:hypothetical protein
VLASACMPGAVSATGAGGSACGAATTGGSAGAGISSDLPQASSVAAVATIRKVAAYCMCFPFVSATVCLRACGLAAAMRALLLLVVCRGRCGLGSGCSRRRRFRGGRCRLLEFGAGRVGHVRHRASHFDVRQIAVAAARGHLADAFDRVLDQGVVALAEAAGPVAPVFEPRCAQCARAMTRSAHCIIDFLAGFFDPGRVGVERNQLGKRLDALEGGFLGASLVVSGWCSA